MKRIKRVEVRMEMFRRPGRQYASCVVCGCQTATWPATTEIPVCSDECATEYSLQRRQEKAGQSKCTGIYDTVTVECGVCARLLNPYEVRSYTHAPAQQGKKKVKPQSWELCEVCHGAVTYKQGAYKVGTTLGISSAMGEEEPTWAVVLQVHSPDHLEVALLFGTGPVVTDLARNKPSDPWWVDSGDMPYAANVKAFTNGEAMKVLAYAAAQRVAITAQVHSL